MKNVLAVIVALALIGLLSYAWNMMAQ